MRRILLLLCFIIVVVSSLFGQARDRYGLLTKVNANISFGQGWKWNSTLESRQIFREVFRMPDNIEAYRYERTDWTNVVSKRSGLTGSYAVGYMLRNTAGKWVHRTLQQMAWTKREAIIRWGHRIRFDQTWQTEAAPTWRFRYRLSIDRPLKGSRLDPGEWYIKASVENIPIIKETQWSYEGRILAALGLYISDANKIEMGWDGRASDIFGTTSYQTWLTFCWYYSI